jgi:hypothetical protein
VQLEGETIYIPPLLYHAVLTCYSHRVPTHDRYTVLSGILFADVREGSLWRKCLPMWVQNHQTGHRHGDKSAVNKKYEKFFDDRVEKRPSKKQKRSSKAAHASLARWKKVKN